MIQGREGGRGEGGGEGGRREGGRGKAVETMWGRERGWAKGRGKTIGLV